MVDDKNQVIKVSIVMPTYNRSAYLKEAIESVLAQTFQDWELFVMDDGSTDQTEAIVRTYAQMDKRVCYLKQPNAGPCVARNTGLRHSTGKYVAFLDDDDRWLPNKLEMQVRVMESDLTIGFSYTRFQIYRKVGNTLEQSKLFPQSLAARFEDLMDNFIAPSSVMFRREVFDQAGEFDTRYRKCDDFDFWLRAGQICKIAAVDQVGVFTVMDGRMHDADDEVEVWKIGIDILRNLKLQPGYLRSKPLIRTHMAKRYYWIGRIFLDRQAYGQAAAHFAKALLMDPLIGLSVRRTEDRGAFSRILKSYAAVIFCLWKSLGWNKYEVT